MGVKPAPRGVLWADKGGTLARLGEVFQLDAIGFWYDTDPVQFKQFVERHYDVAQRD